MRTVYSLEPITESAKSWIADNVQAEPGQWLGGTLAIEHHYVDDIIAGMVEDGMAEDIDFRVN